MRHPELGAQTLFTLSESFSSREKSVKLIMTPKRAELLTHVHLLTISLSCLSYPFPPSFFHLFTSPSLFQLSTSPFH
jgi:hypothetical protein